MISTVFFAHGKESGPLGGKIMALADVAKSRGYRVETPDYTDLVDPDKRVDRLLSLCIGHKVDLLVGSSMGGYVSTVASMRIKPLGLFLMAPAFYIPGYEKQEPHSCAAKTTIVHGWNDDLVPVGNSIRFAAGCRADLHIVDSDHRLNDQIPMLCLLFASLLDDILSQPG